MRKSLPIVVLVAAVLLVGAGCKNKPPKTPARPSGPTAVLVNTSVTYKTVTTDPNGDKIRYEFNWKDGAKDTTAYIASGDTASKAHAWSDTGYYAIRVRAEDDKTNWAPDPSDSLLVHVVSDTGALNQPPAAPAKPTVTGALWMDSTLTVTTSATDPEGDSVSIEFYYGDGSNPTWSAFVPSGATVTGQVAYSTRGRKIIAARAKDVHGDTSDLSPADTVIINAINTAPNAPHIVSWPRRGIAGGPSYRFYAQGTDPQGDSIQYRFYFGSTDSATGALGANGVVGMASWQPNLPVGSYIVRAASIDEFGLMSPLSDPDTFDVSPETTILWAVDNDFVASPALGTAQFYGQNYPAVVAGSRDGQIYLVDAYEGVVASDIVISDADDFDASSSIGSDGTSYSPNEDGSVYAYAPDGTLKWRYVCPDSQGLTTTPVVDGNAIYFGGEGKILRKITDNGSTYTDNWSFTTADELIGSPALGPDGNIIAVDDSGYVYSITPAGARNWSIASGESVGVTASPAIAADGTIYVGTEGGKLIAVKNGSVQWTYVTNPRVSISSSPTIGQSGNIYFAGDDGKLYQVDPSGHDISGWPVQVSLTPISCTPLLCANGCIYLTDDDEKLHCLDANGDSLWVIQLQLPMKKHGPARPRPFAIDVQPSACIDQYGIVYISTSTGLYAVAGNSSRLMAATDWPMFHHDVRHSGKYGARRR